MPTWRLCSLARLPLRPVSIVAQSFKAMSGTPPLTALQGRINVAVGRPARFVSQADGQDARIHRALSRCWSRGEAVEGKIEGQQGTITGSCTTAGVGVDCGGVAVIEALHDE